MYRVDRNNFYVKEKRATVYTPENISTFLFSLLDGKIDRNKPVFDPCVGKGSLLKPFQDKGYEVLGVDINDQGFEGTIKRNYLEIQRRELPDPSLVIINPPFNIDANTKQYIKTHYGGRPLLPEVWLMKAIELFGKSIPLVMFTPYGFRLNQTLTSKRWMKFIDGTYPQIESIISLPKNIFDNVLFHAEILVFNVNKLKGHYFCNEQF